jgi:hypothetical protein
MTTRRSESRANSSITACCAGLGAENRVKRRDDWHPELPLHGISSDQIDLIPHGIPHVPVVPRARTDSASTARP